jgi:transposase InsO family protein
MNSAAGRCHDNARCESFWARAKVEIKSVYNIKKMTKEKLKSVIFRYFMSYWNNRRICSSIGGIPPMVKRNAYYHNLLNIA